MKKLIISTALAAFMVAPVALGQDALTFNGVDADDDYQITFQELKSASSEVTLEEVERYDIDGNEVLTWSEFQKWNAGADPAYRRLEVDNSVDLGALESDATGQGNS